MVKPGRTLKRGLLSFLITALLIDKLFITSVDAYP
jgi:hypothetical protein